MATAEWSPSSSSMLTNISFRLLDFPTGQEFGKVDKASVSTSNQEVKIRETVGDKYKSLLVGLCLGE